MLKANVGLSRKLSKDYNSTGFSLNLEGEINASLDDPETVIERIRELYDLADEALQRQVEAHSGDSSIAAREADNHSAPHQGRPASQAAAPSGQPSPLRNGNQADAKPANGDAATNKQVQYLLTLAKRQKLFGTRLEGFIEDSVGRRCTPYDLSKQEAGVVIDALNPDAADTNRSRR
jgi:hypothetical protein